MENRNLFIPEVEEEIQRFVDTRKSYKMTQAEWAKAIKISISTVKNIERRISSCSRATIRKMEQYIKEHPLVNFEAQYGRPFHEPDHTALDERILQELIASNMTEIPKHEADAIARELALKTMHILKNKTETDHSDVSKEKAYYEKLMLAVDTIGRISPLSNHSNQFLYDLQTAVDLFNKIDAANPKAVSICVELLKNIEHAVLHEKNGPSKGTVQAFKNFWKPLFDEEK